MFPCDLILYKFMVLNCSTDQAKQHYQQILISFSATTLRTTNKLFTQKNYYLVQRYIDPIWFIILVPVIKRLKNKVQDRSQVTRL